MNRQTDRWTDSDELFRQETVWWLQNYLDIQNVPHETPIVGEEKREGGRIKVGT